ncbi:MAG: porin family protein [Alphaproteobacteria bacterium]|nr:porin family protein [Alphaproteobacteria bacterium]
MKKALLMAGAAALFASSANAEVKPYVGLDGNYSSIDWAYDIEDSVEDDYTSVSAVAGAKFIRNFGMEAFYQISNGEKNRDANAGLNHSRFTAYGVDALGYLPLGCEGKVELIAGAGVGEYTFKVRNTFDGTSKDHSTGYRLNAGAQYNVDENWSVRGMYRHVYTQKSYADAIDEFSLGVRYNF